MSLTCEEFESPLHGRGVRACRPIRKGEIIFEEKPYHLLHTLPNRQLVYACAACHQPLGSAALQLQVLQKSINRQNMISEIESIEPLPGESASQEAGHSCNIIPCSAHCGEYYCSDICRDIHWRQRGHSMLCTGSISDEEAESHPLMKFKIHAVSSNEIFLMVAELFAFICSQLNELVGSGQPLSDALRVVEAPLQGYVKQLWWDAAKCPAGSSAPFFKKTLKRLVNESWDLLNEALHLTAKGYDTLLSSEYMARSAISIMMR